MKLFKLFIVGLKKNYNGEAALCWSHFIFSWEATPLQQNLTYLKSFSAGLIGKKKKQEKKNKQADDIPFFC